MRGEKKEREREREKERETEGWREAIIYILGGVVFW